MAIFAINANRCNFAILYFNDSTTDCLAGAEPGSVGGPLSVACGDEIADHPADILLLSGIVIRSGVVSRHRHRPSFVFVVQVPEELCRVFNIAFRVEHLFRGRKIFAVEVVVDLHAADVDELHALPLGVVKGRHRRLLRGWKKGLSLDIHGIGAEAALAAGLG